MPSCSEGCTRCLRSGRQTWPESRNLSTLPPREGLVAHYEFDGHLSDTSGHYHHAQTVRGDVTFGQNAVGLGG